MALFEHRLNHEDGQDQDVLVVPNQMCVLALVGWVKLVAIIQPDECWEVATEDGLHAKINVARQLCQRDRVQIEVMHVLRRECGHELAKTIDGPYIHNCKAISRARAGHACGGRGHAQRRDHALKEDLERSHM